MQGVAGGATTRKSDPLPSSRTDVGSCENRNVDESQPLALVDSACAPMGPEPAHPGEVNGHCPASELAGAPCLNDEALPLIARDERWKSAAHIADTPDCRAPDRLVVIWSDRGHAMGQIAPALQIIRGSR